MLLRLVETVVAQSVFPLLCKLVVAVSYNLKDLLNVAQEPTC